MSAPTGKVVTRSRRAQAVSDDDDEPVAVPKVAEGENVESTEVTTTAMRPPLRAKPKAPSARAADAQHADPNATEGSASSAPSSAAVRRDPAEVLELNYDAMTYDEFLAVLGGVTKNELWAVIQHRVDALLETEQVPTSEAVDEEAEGDEEGMEAKAAGRPYEAVGPVRLEKFVDGSGGYTYAFLLRRICEALKLNNEQSATTERNKIPMPIIEKLGKKKTVMVNFGAICTAIGRSMEDVKDYLDKELSTQGSIDSNDSLIMKIQTVKPNQFDNVLFQYMDEYVKCNSCHKINTTLTKEGRITVLKCNLCKASRTVQAMNSATYNAQIGKRSKARLQALTL